MSLPLLLRQCIACLARLAWNVFKMGGRCPYSCCFVECYLQDLFNTARSILVQLPSGFLFLHQVGVHMMHPYSSMDTTSTWKKLHFILYDFYINDNLLMIIHAFVSHVLISLYIYIYIYCWNNKNNLWIS